MKRTWLVASIVGGVLALGVALGRPDRPAVAEEGGAAEFTGPGACRKCHFKHQKSWKDTKHAKALDILKAGERAEAKTAANLDPQKDYTKDAACLACHTTGYGQPGGFPELKDAWDEAETKRAKEHGGVGCESCHGPGSLYGPYKADNEQYKREEIAKLGMKVPVTAESCTGCHKAEGNPTAGTDYVFDFEKAKTDAAAIHEHVALQHPH